MKRAIVFLTCLITGGAFAPSLARAGSGLYVGSDIGANFASGPDLDESDNDRATVCDEFHNPLFADVPGCTDPAGRGDRWMSEFDAAEGILAGASLGYSLRNRLPDSPLGRFRLELEYFYRNSEYDQTANIQSGDGGGGSVAEKLAGEIVQAEDRIGDMTSHNLFGNLYCDFFNISRFTPYIGFGVGAGFTDMDYSDRWVRNIDPDRSTAGQGLSNANHIRRSVAGTVTSEQSTLTDALFGYQVLFGLDYALTESLSLGVKGRWVNFDTFQDRGSWDRLRSHDSQLRLDGSEPVRWKVKTDDIEFFGVSLSLKYHF